MKLGKSKKARAREAALAAEAANHAEAVEAMYNAAMARAELAENAQLKADERLAAAVEREEAANERVAQAEARERAAVERLAAAEAREAEATEQVSAAEQRVAAIGERMAAVDERVAAVAEREQAISERVAAVQAREAAVQAREAVATERDAIANDRDRAGAARDVIANDRDRAAAEREAPRRRLPAASLDDPSDQPDTELERARLEAELQRAHLDSLTGAFRREMGRLALRNEIERAKRADGRFVIAFVDVDGLKIVNDRDGHAAGDKILRTLAATMRANLRSYDPIVRYGGDEFVCGIASIDTEEVEHRIGVIDQSLRNATGVGVTAGLATMTADESLEELTSRADAALIEAKRNRDS